MKKFLSVEVEFELSSRPERLVNEVFLQPHLFVSRYSALG
jgi:hypothetical protein